MPCEKIPVQGGGFAIVCRAPGWTRRRMHCGYCDEVRRFVYREVFGGYVSDAICGWCGTSWTDGELHPARLSDAQRQTNRETVATAWTARKDRGEECGYCGREKCGGMCQS